MVLPYCSEVVVEDPPLAPTPLKLARGRRENKTDTGVLTARPPLPWVVPSAPPAAPQTAAYG